MSTIFSSPKSTTTSTDRKKNPLIKKRTTHLYSETEVPEYEDPPHIKRRDALLEGTSGSQRLCITILFSGWFEHFLCVAIVFNFILVVLETDACATAESEECTGRLWMSLMSSGILLLFTVELGARIYAEGYKFWEGDAWNMFDFFIISLDLVLFFVEIGVGKIANISALRILRLCRLLRLFRMFPELYLMVASLLGSLQAIFWGSLLLFIVILVFAVLAVQFIHPLNKDLPEMGYYGGCTRCAHAYESVFQSALTLTQQIVAGDSWGQATIPVIESFPWTVTFFIGAYLCIGLVLLNLITGVVVTVADEARAKLKEQLDDESLLQRLNAHTTMLSICQSMDSNGDGTVTKEDLYQGYASSEAFRDQLFEMDIKEEDLAILWTILDSDKTGRVSVNDLLTRVFKMKSSDTHFMLTYIKYYITLIKHDLSEDMRQVMDRLEKDIEKGVSEIERDVNFGYADIDTHIERAEGEVSLEIKKLRSKLSSKLSNSTNNVNFKVSSSEASSQNWYQPVDVKGKDQRNASRGDMEQFGDLIEGARQFRHELMTSLQQVDRSLNACLSRTSISAGVDLDLASVPFFNEVSGEFSFARTQVHEDSDYTKDMVGLLRHSQQNSKRAARNRFLKDL